MLTIIPFKNLSKDKEDSYFKLLETLRSTPPNELIQNFFGVEKEQIYNLIFKTNDISKLTNKSLEKNVRILSEFFLVFSNVFSQIEDLSINNKVHHELFDKLINFICTSFQLIFKNYLNEAFINLVNFHKLLRRSPDYQQKIVNFLFEEFFSSKFNVDKRDIINKSKDSLTELIISCIEAKYENKFYIDLYVRLYNLFNSQEELLILNDKKIYRHASNLIKKSTNLPNEFIRLIFYLKFIEPMGTFENINLSESELLNIIPKKDFSFEMSVLKSMIDSDLSILEKTNTTDGIRYYGRKSCQKLLSNITLRIINEKLNKIKETSVSFSDLKNKYSVKLEELEEVLIDGSENKLFEVIVDYKESKVNIKFIRKSEFSKESLQNMKTKISNLKQTILNFKQKIDNLTN